MTKTIGWKSEPKGPGRRAVHMFLDAQGERVELLAYDCPASGGGPRMCGFEVFGRLRKGGPFHDQLAAGEANSLAEAMEAAQAMVSRPRQAWAKLPRSWVGFSEAPIAAPADAKPALCYAVVPGAEPGKRIGVIKRGEAGYHLTDYDRKTASAEFVREFVDQMNDQLGVDKLEARAMLCGSMFGWNVPAANSDHQRDAIAEADAVAAATSALHWSIDHKGNHVTQAALRFYQVAYEGADRYQVRVDGYPIGVGKTLQAGQAIAQAHNDR